MRCVTWIVGLLVLVCSSTAITADLKPTGLQDQEELISLSTSIQPFVRIFNAEQNTPTFLAILSPTCGACRHGVEAIQEALSGDARGGRLRILVVWAPMLASDNEAAAQEAFRHFGGLAAAQFYDPERRIGNAFRNDVFPRAADEMLSSLPPGHYLRASLAGRSNDIPEWDIYMFFDAATEWMSEAPRPSHWVRQVARVQDEKGDLISVMWRDSYASPPTEGGLADQLRESKRTVMTGKNPDLP